MMISEEIETGLSSEEISYARRILGREPNPLEWAMIDAEWSEHCSYKSSRLVLRRLPTKGEGVLVGPGYDSGVISIGGGHVMTLHIESHNHPSAIDPYGGAATGIGGVIRDILCMGTRPIALLNALRFGPINNSAHSRWLFKNVVRGIADYGNCTGIPTVGGELEFDECFEKNCLVDVVCLGAGRRRDLVLARASRAGDSVILVGGSTGRDGIHGSTFASRVLSGGSDEDRPAVQIPDPFAKKLIIEATLEAVSTGCVRALKDLGGGGLACALSEMADKGDAGIEINLSNVHLREKEMAPIEIMISESQERRLFVVRNGSEAVVDGVFEKYGIKSSTVGRVTRRNEIVVKQGRSELARLPSKFLANAPVIRRKVRKPRRRMTKLLPPQPGDMREALICLLASPTVASKEWVYEQYDHEVGVRTVLKPGQADAAVIRLPNKKFAAIKIDGNSRHCYLDPYSGAASCVAEACRNVVAVGGKPMAMLDHCQFGDPSDPEVYWDFERAVDGMADACNVFGLPCIGGKVSFYNEDGETGNAIKPTPVVVVVGLVDDEEHITTMDFKTPGEQVVLVGRTRFEIGGSEYLYAFHGIESGPPPFIDLPVEKATMDAVLACIRAGYIEACHDCSKGGLAVALAEMCIAGDIGARIDLRKAVADKMRLDGLLFSESNSRFILATRHPKQVLEFLRRHKLPSAIVGDVDGNSLEFSYGKHVVSFRVDELSEAYRNSLGSSMEAG